MNNEYQWQVIASDYNSPLFRNFIWVKAFFKYAQYLGVYRPRLGVYSEADQIKYLTDLNTWTKTHNQLKAKVLKNMAYLNDIIDQSMIGGVKFNRWSLKNIFQIDLTTLSNQSILKILEEFMDKQSLEYAYGVALPILDFQGFSFIEKNLHNFLDKNVPERERAEAFNVFTYPVKNSFAQDQELALLKLMVGYFDNKYWRQDVLKKDLNYLSNIYPDFGKKLKAHTQKYAWVYYVYAGPAYSENNFLEFIRDYLKKGINPKAAIVRMKTERAQADAKKKELVKKYQPNKFYRDIIYLAAKMVWAKPRRKDYQSQSYYHCEKLLREFGRRLGLSLNQVRSTPVVMLKEFLLKKKKPDTKLINDFYKCHLCLPNDDGRVWLVSGKQAHNFYQKKVIKEKRVKKNEINKELKGACACSGKARGVVRLVNLAVDMTKMNYGDILVSTATTPAIVAAMKKASAIVTDEGGLTCHAAIVSRELHIPCVIGTKIATQVLNDGDLVEVEADKGVVKKIK